MKSIIEIVVVPDGDLYLSFVLRKPIFCGNCEADQRLCFCYIDSTIPLLSKFEISSL